MDCRTDRHKHLLLRKLSGAAGLLLVALMLGKSFVVAAATPDLPRAAVAAETRDGERWAPEGEVIRSLEGLPERLSYLNVGNPRDSFWPEVIASFPDKAEPALQRFSGLNVPSTDEVEPPDLLTILGVPKRARSGVRNTGAKAPRADVVRAYLYPSVVAATIDNHSFRFLSLEALPLACVGLEAKYDARGSLSIELKFGCGK